MDRWLKVGVISSVVSLNLVLLATGNLADPDLWGYLAFGRLFWHSQTFPYHDVFSYLPTVPWVYHEWLTGVLFYPLYQTLGTAGLQFLRYGLALATFALVYLTARRRGAYPLAAVLFVVIIATAVRSFYHPVRAQVFTFCFFALSLYLLERARLTRRWQGLSLLPLIQVPWCNLHGGFLAGLGLIAIYAFGEFLGRRPSLPYLTALMVSTLVTLINPYGVEYWQYLVHAVTMPRPYITEWASVFQAYRAQIVNLTTIIYMLTLVLAGLLGMWHSRWREVTASLVLAVTLVLGLRHIRHVPFFLLSAGAYLPVCLNMNLDFLLARLRIKQLGCQARLTIAAMVFLGLFTLANLSFFAIKNPLSWELPDTSTPQVGSKIYYPQQAVNLIKKLGISGKILAQFVWGEYLIWELYPRCLVALDGRYETVYSPEIAENYFDFYYARPGWRQFLSKYPPDLILMDTRMKIVELLRQEPHWRQVYADEKSALFLAAGAIPEGSGEGERLDRVAK